VAGGDGLVNVGFINANGRDLGTVLVDGDLGRIDAGDPANPAGACKGLTAQSLGVFGTSTGAPDLLSTFNGRLDKLTIATDVKAASVRVVDSSGANHGSIGPIFIGGSLIGGAAANTGEIVSANAMGPVTIRGDVIGCGSQTGFIHTTAAGPILGVTIGGSLLGGYGANSGKIFTVNVIGPVKIGGDIKGDAAFSGLIDGGSIASVTIGRSLLGGDGTASGAIFSQTSIGPVKIGKSIIGDGSDMGALDSGVINAGSLGAVTLGDSLLGGFGERSGQIKSAGAIGVVKINGDIRGGVGGQKDAGIVDAGTTLAGITVGGSVLGGNGENSGRISTAGAMGNVTIGGSLMGGAGASSGRIRSGDTIRAVVIKGDVLGDGQNSAVITSAGAIASVTIGGSLIGDSIGSGAIDCGGALGLVKIGRDVTTSFSTDSGHIFSMGAMAGVRIGGSLDGAGIGADHSAEIRSDSTIGPISIAGSVIGGINGSGRIFSTGGLASVTIGGSLLGGYEEGTGEIRSAGNIGPVKIAGDIVGGTFSSYALGGSGYIEGARIASLFVGGSIRAGVDDDSRGKHTNQVASVRAINDIGPIVIKGSLLGTADADGNSNDGDYTYVTIIAGGKSASDPGSISDVAIKSLTVGGRVENARILAGYDVDGTTPRNADAQIGKVTVGGDWIASQLIAGVRDNNGDGFGNGDDAKIPNLGQTGFKDDPDLGGAGAISKIAGVIIKGRALGTVDSSDAALFGIEAQQLGTIKIGIATISFNSVAGDDLFANRRTLALTRGTSGPDGFDFRAFEVPLT
jgi:filamentous hemagglutinin